MAESRTSSSDDAPARERDDLLATKFHVPRIRPERLARSRLIQRLNEGVARGVVLVCTPAGYGKSTLLANWAEGSKWPVAWLSLDREDNDPVRFWRYVVAALDRVSGRVNEHVLPLLAGPSVLSGQGVVTALVNELAAVPDELALVLDDYHVIESRSVHDDMAFLLGHLPPQLHVVITSRSDPPLLLARLRAKGQLAELRADDLRFTREESSDFLRQVWELDLSPDAIGALETRTEGWAVGLQLAALSLRERPDPDAFLHAFTGTHRYVLDYLSEEVLDRQPEGVRAFLLETSILERLSGPLCDAVTGRSDGQDMLEGLERANLFLVPLDEERRWFRFHHLFGELLRVRLHRAEPARVADLHRRAAAWCEHHGLLGDAIRHASASGDAVWATRLVEQHLNETLHRQEGALLERWLSQLPQAAVRSRPALCLAQGLMELFLGRLDSVQRLLEQAERAFDAGQGPWEFGAPSEGGMVAEVPAAIALLRAELAAARGDALGTARYATSALAELAEEEGGPRLWARWLLASGDWMGGRLADAEHAFAEMLAEGRAAADPYPLMTSCFMLGRVQRARGELRAALRTYREALRFATEGGRLLVYHAAEAHLGLAEVLYERDQLDEALKHATKSVELGRQVIGFQLPVLSLVTLGWIRQAMGDRDGALEAMNEACQMHQGTEVVTLHHPAPAERARLLLAQGRAGEAERWTQERGLTGEDEISYAGERDYLVLAGVLLARPDPDRALRLLKRLDALAESQDRKESLIQIRAVRSLALQSAEDHRGAVAMLADALSLARPEGYIRVFADEGPPMAALLRSLVGARRRGSGASVAGATREHLIRVVQAFGSAGQSEKAASASTALIEPLTSRELEILRFIAAGRRNREIAQELVVTLDTVKKHVSSILGKLGASSRTQAVGRARELGLIS
jgi:LuxR family transcriptional regulator, maltose regulon positive regulatory protein